MKPPMAMPEVAGLPALEARRWAVIDVLKDRFAHGEIELKEYERRIAVASAAQRNHELTDLVRNLGRNSVPAPSGPAATQQLIAVMSCHTYTSDWLRADAVVVYALMGSVVLDFTEVRPGDRPIVVEVRSLMSDASSRVPLGVPVQMDVDAILSDASVHKRVARGR